METLDKTSWDVLISGTGLTQALLVLALSRADKKVLHVDQNPFYGGPEAAFSLQEAEDWSQSVNKEADNTVARLFSNATLYQAPSDDTDTKLSFSRAYSLTLSPQLIYTRSSVINALISSKIYKQLEFLAVGTWWVYSRRDAAPGTLVKVPSGREDIFTDTSFQAKEKRALMKFLRFIVDFEEQTESWEQYREVPFSQFLSESFKIPTSLRDPLQALTLTTQASDRTMTGYALPRIARHLRSIGAFGPGFGAIIPKWGGLSEIVQVACRAGAVGGATYVLGKGLEDVVNGDSQPISVSLDGGDSVSTTWLAGSSENFPSDQRTSNASSETLRCSRSISIVSSPMDHLLPSLGEGAPPPAAAVVVFPGGSLVTESFAASSTEPPVNIFVHSSESGECPRGQSVIYASIESTSENATGILQTAVEKLLQTSSSDPKPRILWSLNYEIQPSLGSSMSPNTITGPSNHVVFSRSSLDLAFDDSVLSQVKSAWQSITGGTDEEFLAFEDREAMTGDDNADES